MSILNLFAIKEASERHPYLQIYDTVVHCLKTGELAPGQKLPTVRRLAEHLGVAVNTVASAYRELERKGIAEGRGRAGTFISLGPDPVLEEARAVALRASADLLSLGLTEHEATNMFLESLRTTVENG